MLQLNDIPCSMINSGIQPDHYNAAFRNFKDLYSETNKSGLFKELEDLANKVISENLQEHYVFLVGTPGCGKSMFLVCLFRALVRAQKGVMGADASFYFQFARLINEVIEDLEIVKSTRKSLSRKVLPIKHLFIDDFSTHVQVGDPNKIESVILREILVNRFEQQKYLIATSNYTKSSFKQMIKNTYGEYLVSRIFSSSVFIEFPKLDVRKSQITV